MGFLGVPRWRSPKYASEKTQALGHFHIVPLSLSVCLSFFLSVSAAVVALHSTQLSHQSWRAGIFLTAEAPGNSLYQGGIHPVKRTARRNSADFLFTQFDAGFEISDLEMLY